MTTVLVILLSLDGRDGNPIYGPYGLEDPDNIQSDVQLQTSSYAITLAILSIDSKRVPIWIFSR